MMRQGRSPSLLSNKCGLSSLSYVLSLHEVIRASAHLDAMRPLSCSQISERTEDYLIEWDGVDKDGKPYKPSWVRSLFLTTRRKRALLVRKQTTC